MVENRRIGLRRERANRVEVADIKGGQKRHHGRDRDRPARDQTDKRFVAHTPPDEPVNKSASERRENDVAKHKQSVVSSWQSVASRKENSDPVFLSTDYRLLTTVYFFH